MSSTRDGRAGQSAGGTETETDQLWESYADATGFDAAAATETETLRRERDFWRGLFDQLVGQFPKGVLVTDGDGTLTHWNDTLGESLGIDASDAVGENAYDVIGTEGESETLAEEVIRTGAVTEEDQLREVLGADAIYRVYGVPLRGPDGTVAGAFEVTPDVSEYVERRRELESLQRRVQEDVVSRLEALDDGVSEVAAFSSETESFAETQSHRMDEVTDEVAQQSATIQEIASSAEEVSQAAQTARDRASDGEATAEDAIEQMEAVRAAADDVSGTIDDLTEQAAEVQEITAVIDDIADQTNMLALNASIEAARAGEAGEGFAVVADEVKNLAEESQSRASQIEAQITEMVAVTDRTATELDDIRTEVTETIAAVQETVDALHEINEVVAETATGAQEVARATDDHAVSTEEVAATVEEASDELDTLRRRLADLNETTTEQRQRLSEIETTVDDLVEG